jgi:hypothetical protein
MVQEGVLYACKRLAQDIIKPKERIEGAVYHIATSKEQYYRHSNGYSTPRAQYIPGQHQ